MSDKIEMGRFVEGEVPAFTGNSSEDRKIISGRMEDLEKKDKIEYGLPFYKLGLQATIGDDLLPEDLDQLAERCLKNVERAKDVFESRMIGLKRLEQGDIRSNHVEQAPFLNGWDRDQLRSLLNDYNGLVICNFHFGSHQFVVLDLAEMGFDVVFPISLKNKKKYENLTPEKWSLHLPLVSESSIGLTLARALRSEKIIVLNTDANEGADGPSGGKGRVRVDFLGRTLKVKAGAARTGAAFNVPILPVFAFSSPISEPTMVQWGKPITPESREFPSGSSCENRIIHIMQKLYDQYAEIVAEYPELWAYPRFIHRWCEPLNISSNSSISTNETEKALSVNCRTFVMNDYVVTSVPINGDIAWMDSRNFESLTPPTWCPDLISTLSGSGIDADWINVKTSRGVSYERLLKALTYLWQQRRVLYKQHRMITSQ